MATVNYNTADMETVLANSVTISTNITTAADAIDGVLSGVDKRVYDYYEFFKEMNEKSGSLRWEETNANNFGSWMSDTYDEFKRVKTNVEGGSGKGIPDLSLPDAHSQFPTINVDPSKVTPYDLTSDAWEKLSTEDKKAIEAKLKELGFTDEEIQAIKDGNASVNKTVLDKLDSELTKLNNNGSDVRQVILEKYGFDVFNEDGTIDKDKLALAMLIDNKNPNDDYDLVALLKNKYGIDLFPKGSTTPGTTIPTPGTVDPTLPDTGDSTTNDNPTQPTTVHTGVSYGGEGSGNEQVTDLSEIENMLSGSEDESLLDGLDGLAGSISNRQKGFDIGFKGNGKGGAGVAGVAGLAGLGAAATVAGLLAKKRKEDAILGDDDEYDDDDYLDDDFDEDLDENNLLKDKLNEDIDDDDNSISKNKKKKDWLYGLGIGLAGAGLAAGLLAKDEDDEDDDY